MQKRKTDEDLLEELRDGDAAPLGKVILPEVAAQEGDAEEHARQHRHGIQFPPEIEVRRPPIQADQAQGDIEREREPQELVGKAESHPGAPFQSPAQRHRRQVNDRHGHDQGQDLLGSREEMRHGARV